VIAVSQLNRAARRAPRIIGRNSAICAAFWRHRAGRRRRHVRVPGGLLPGSGSRQTPATVTGTQEWQRKLTGGAGGAQRLSSPKHRHGPIAIVNVAFSAATAAVLRPL